MATRKSVLRLSLALAGFLSARASQAALLPGNVWPNPTLETAAPAGVDQVYSYYNGNYSSGGPYMPNTTGDSNPRPAGWHRGNGDFGTTTTPTYTFWDTSKSLSPTHSLEVSDTNTSNGGEWFSDYNALPAGSQNTGVPFNFRFNLQYANITSTQRPVGSDVFRVSVRWADAVSDNVLTTENDTGGPDYLIYDGTPNLTTFTQIDELLTPPANAKAMRVTIDSGGSGQATGQIWVDDISIAAVPEPTSIAVVGAGLALLSTRRRKA